MYYFFLNCFVLSSVSLVYSKSVLRLGQSGPQVKLTEETESMKFKKQFDEGNINHWREQAQWLLKKKITENLNRKVAKNVILFLGDGMSIATLAATRTYLGNMYGFPGEELKLSFETFPFTGLAKTYCVDYNVADSACSATAYLTGVKANSGTVGVSAGVKKGDCDAQLSGNFSVTGLMAWAQNSGKGTGLVTTTRITHATPAASYAHSADRRWEADTDLPKGTECDDIATQLVHGKVGSRINVILGGGRRNFFPSAIRDEQGTPGYRSDGVNLVHEWLGKQSKLKLKAKYVTNKKGLDSVFGEQVDKVLGLFSPNHMPYHLEASSEVLPTLTDMTIKALEVLKHHDNGFFLFVEGGRIDTAHHETKAWKALDETVELAKAVEATLKHVNLEETLVIVTSDHSHTMTYSGYSSRGSNILGFVDKHNASDNMPYTTLSYANGPGHKTTDENHKRHNLLNDDINNIEYTFPSLVPMSRETHGGEDVAVFAKGPWAHLFTGNYEQNYIPHAIGFAACLGEGATICDPKNLLYAAMVGTFET